MLPLFSLPTKLPQRVLLSSVDSPTAITSRFIFVSGGSAVTALTTIWLDPDYFSGIPARCVRAWARSCFALYVGAECAAIAVSPRRQLLPPRNRSQRA